VIKTPLHKRAVTWLTTASFTALLLRGIGTSDVAEWKEWSRRVHGWLAVVGAVSQLVERVRGGESLEDVTKELYVGVPAPAPPAQVSPRLQLCPSALTFRPPTP
jgi:hypothetical protein